MATDNRPVITPFENGMEVVNITNRMLNTMSIGFLVGTRDDPESFSGAAHTAEHILCRGSSERAADRIEADSGVRPVTDRQMNRVLRRYLGGTHDCDIRIHTAHSYMGFGHADLSSRRNMETVFQTFASVIRDGMFAMRRMDHDKTMLDLHSYRIEKSAVDNETGLNDENFPLMGLKAALALMYRTNPARLWGDSDPAQLARVKLGSLKQWAQTQFVPAKMRIMMVGPDPNEALRMVRQAGLDEIPGWTATPTVRVDPGDITPVLTDMREGIIERPGAKMTHVVMLWPTETFMTSDRSALEVLSGLLDGIVEDETRERNMKLPGGVYHPETGWDVSSTHGYLQVWFATRGGRAHADELTERVLSCLRRLPDDSSAVFEEDVRDIRDNMVDTFTNMYRFMPDELVDMLLFQLANGDDELESFSRYKSDLAAVTAPDVRNAARKYLTTDRFVRVVVQPA